MTRPTNISLEGGTHLRFVWSDGHITRFSLQQFRDACPCAGCKGESDIFGDVKMPLQLPVVTPGTYELTSLQPVGNYAIAARWGDGHDTGIYSWEYLLSLEAERAADDQEAG
jgi:DUF971 family protein